MLDDIGKEEKGGRKGGERRALRLPRELSNNSSEEGEMKQEKGETESTRTPRRSHRIVFRVQPQEKKRGKGGGGGFGKEKKKGKRREKRRNVARWLEEARLFLYP